MKLEMNDAKFHEVKHDMANIVGSLFLLTNRLQTIMDRTFENRSLTTKQWFMMAVISKLFTSPPKLSDVASCMGSSYQNVKQIALKLEKNGYISMKRDPSDQRVIRITLAPHYENFWEEQVEEDMALLEALFNQFTPKEISQFVDYIERLYIAIEKSEQL